MLSRILFASVLASTVFAQNAAGPIWTKLFNEKDLTGWVEVGKEKWLVADGTIHGMAITEAYGYLKTEKTYKDFHLSMRFKCEGGGNSGLFFHVDFKPGTPEVAKGMQFEIDCKINTHTGGVYDNDRQWIVWPAPELEGVVRQSDWNDLQVVVDGNRYISRLNGVQMIDFTDPRQRALDGFIALQLHSGGAGNMRFKDIYIRDLTKR
jgi:hypothetical protein